MKLLLNKNMTKSKKLSDFKKNKKKKKDKR